MKTYVVKESDINREWYVVDAAGQTLGRLASKVSQILKGKHKRIFTPSLDVGDYVIVVNADKVAVTGRKMENKMYYRYTGYPGNLKEFSLADMMKRHPTHALKHAVKGMLPKNPLGRKMLSKLKVYAGAEHPHEAQQPKVLEL